MRSLNLCLSLALLLCLQAYAADSQDPLVGTWSNPKKNKDIGLECCVPDKIEIVKDGSNYKGTYSYTRFINAKCTVMLVTSKGNDVTFTKKSNSDVYGISVKIFEDVTILGNKLPDIPVEGYLSKVLSSSQLEIYNPQRINKTTNATELEASTCDFTMNTFVAGTSSSTPNSNTSVPDAGTSTLPVKYIAIGAGVAFLFLCIACKCRQKKQIIIIQHESAYGAPNMYHPNQPYYGQKGPIIQTR